MGVTHLVLDVAPQWVIERNVTGKSNIEHIGTIALVFVVDGHRDQISIVNTEFLSYVLLDCFTSHCQNCSTLPCISVTLDNAA